jgi:hypothetical protein
MGSRQWYAVRPCSGIAARLAEVEALGQGDQVSGGSHGVFGVPAHAEQVDNPVVG